jgi:hypothetical protein
LWLLQMPPWITQFLTETQLNLSTDMAISLVK